MTATRLDDIREFWTHPDCAERIPDIEPSELQSDVDWLLDLVDEMQAQIKKAGDAPA
jgi:hypothetical protein